MTDTFAQITAVFFYSYKLPKTVTTLLLFSSELLATILFIL